MLWRVLVSIAAISGAAFLCLAGGLDSAPAASKGGAYFGLEPPTEKPEVFAAGVVDVPGRSIGHLAFSRDGLECCVTVFESAYHNNHILCARAQGASWTALTPLGILGDRETLEPLFSRTARSSTSAHRVRRIPDPTRSSGWRGARTAHGPILGRSRCP